MRIIRITVLLIAMLCMVIAVSAAEPLVQEGKLWIHSISTNWTSYWYNSENTMFFGSPEELYGNTYFPVKDTDTDRVYAYMRQDGGKVYILVDGTIYEQLYYYQDDTEVSLAPGDEVLAYDFDAKPGDSYISASSGDMGVNYGKGVYGIEDIVEVTVDAVDTVVVNGTERKRQKVHIGDKSHQYTIVDGIGANEGLFFVPEYGPFTTGNGAQFARIKEVIDIGGEVLFTGADFDAPTLTREPLVREGVTWNHVVSYINAYVYDTSEFYSLYFDSPVEMYGKTYHPLKNHNSDTDVYAYMRQEGNKVYLLVDGGYTQPLEGDGVRYEVGNEVLLYDFDVKEGNEYWSPSIGEEFSWPYVNPWLEKVTVKKVDTVMVNGVLRKRLQVEGTATVSIIEGLGANIGYMHIPGFGPYCACIHRTESNVKDVLDSDGNVIITFEDYNAPAYDAGVPEVSFDTGMTPAKDNKMYDLNGREIRNPLPGTVYIQNGEKRVAK